MTHVTVVTVAFGAEPWLERSVEAALRSSGVTVDVVVVDNGCTDGAVERLSTAAGVTVVRPGRNTGFAEGCNLGVAAASSALVALVNPDALVEPGALAALAAVASRDEVGVATASVRLADRPERLNSAGNEVHFTGLSWSGHFDELASARVTECDVMAASGAAMMVRPAVWERLGGFDADFFAYYEDADLSVRAWQAGYRVVYVPEAVVLHRYEFSRNTDKMYLLERNRSMMVLTCFSRRLLLAVALPLLMMEVATFGAALAQGWWREKGRSWVWLATNGRRIAARRRAVQSARVMPDSCFVPLLATRIDPGNLPPPSPLKVLDAVLGAYWGLVRRWV